LRHRPLGQGGALAERREDRAPDLGRLVGGLRQADRHGLCPPRSRRRWHEAQGADVAAGVGRGRRRGQPVRPVERAHPRGRLGPPESSHRNKKRGWFRPLFFVSRGLSDHPAAFAASSSQQASASPAYMSVGPPPIWIAMASTSPSSSRVAPAFISASTWKLMQGEQRSASAMPRATYSFSFSESGPLSFTALESVAKPCVAPGTAL